MILRLFFFWNFDQGQYKGPHNLASIFAQNINFKDKLKTYYNLNRNINSLQTCVKKFSRECLPRFARQVTNLVLFGVTKVNKPLCINDENKSAFGKVAKCGNINIESKHKCMDEFIDDLKATETESGDKKIPFVCWYELSNIFLFFDLFLFLYFFSIEAIFGNSKIVLKKLLNQSIRRNVRNNQSMAF